MAAGPPGATRRKLSRGAIAAIASAVALAVLCVCGIPIGALIWSLARLDSGGASDTPECGYKLAVMAPLTGPAPWPAPRHGAQVAVDRYNAQHPDCTVELVEFDSGGQASNAESQAHRIVRDDRLLGVVGPNQIQEALAAVPVLSSAGVPMIGPLLANISLTEGGAFHRSVGSDSAMAKATGRYITEDLGGRKVYVVSDSAPYNDQVAGQVRTALGAAWVGSAKLAAPGIIPDVVAATRRMGADTIVVAGILVWMDQFLVKLRAAGSTAKVLTTDSTSAILATQGSATPQARAAAEGLVAVSPLFPPENLPAEFREAHQRVAGAAPQAIAAEGYDAANILLAGIQAGHHTRDSLLGFVDDYEGKGLTKEFRFLGNGDLDPVVAPFWTLVIRGGTLVPGNVIPPR